MDMLAGQLADACSMLLDKPIGCPEDCYNLQHSKLTPYRQIKHRPPHSDMGKVQSLNEEIALDGCSGGTCLIKHVNAVAF
jgi:hypothetical protein